MFMTHYYIKVLMVSHKNWSGPTSKAIDKYLKCTDKLTTSNNKHVKPKSLKVHFLPRTASSVFNFAVK